MVQPLRRSQEPGSGMAAFILVFLVFSLGAWIPLPGVDAETLASLAVFPSDRMAARFSIFSLGLMPLLSVFVHAELAKLIFPRLARWQRASARNWDRWNDILRLLALILAALQGYGIALGSQAAGVGDRTDATFVPICIATFVGSTALLSWLIDRVRLPGLGNGFWFLWVVPFVGGLPITVIQLIDLSRTGGMEPSAGWLGLVYVLLAIMMAVTANLILDQEVEAGPAAEPTLAAAIWPPFLASIVANYLIFAVTLSVSVMTGSLLESATLEHVVLTALLIPAIGCLYALRWSGVDSTGNAQEGEKTRKRFARFLLAGLLQAAICLGIGMLTWMYPAYYPLNSALLIAVVTVVMSLLRTRRPRSGTMPPGGVAPVTR